MIKTKLSIIILVMILVVLANTKKTTNEEYDAAFLSLDSYNSMESEISTSTVLKKKGWNVLRILSSEHINTKIYINDKLKKIAVAYRGSELIYEDWFETNINTNMTSCEFQSVHLGNVHSGFLKEYLHDHTSVLETIIPYVLNGHYQVLYTGHSQGGAMATIGSLHLSFLIPHHPATLITFGCPHVGDAEFINNLHSLVKNRTRFVHSVPFHSFNYGNVAFSFSHDEVAPVVLSSVNNDYVHMDGVVRLLCNTRSDFGIFECHRMSSYIESIQKHNNQDINISINSVLDYVFSPVGKDRI
ncbi:lipase [Acrasis kona]|uniref:Lipase n=1 Tax=Acrasis kona TaxID=1008807 RepID=A0AAW2ZQ80_9EUKA